MKISTGVFWFVSGLSGLIAVSIFISSRLQSAQEKLAQPEAQQQEQSNNMARREAIIEKVKMRAAEQEKQRERQTMANCVVDGIRYIKDPRTGFCFAYIWSGSGYTMEGPSLTLVPEKDIPTNLLTTARIADK